MNSLIIGQNHAKPVAELQREQAAMLFRQSGQRFVWFFACAKTQARELFSSERKTTNAARAHRIDGNFQQRAVEAVLVGCFSGALVLEQRRKRRRADRRRFYTISDANQKNSKHSTYVTSIDVRTAESSFKEIDFANRRACRKNQQYSDCTVNLNTSTVTKPCRTKGLVVFSAAREYFSILLVVSAFIMYFVSETFICLQAKRRVTIRSFLHDIRSSCLHYKTQVVWLKLIFCFKFQVSLRSSQKAQIYFRAG